MQKGECLIFSLLYVKIFKCGVNHSNVAKGSSITHEVKSANTH